jgi:hypothetical protein
MARLNARVLSTAPKDWSSRSLMAVLRTESFGSVMVFSDCSLSSRESSSLAAAARASRVGCRVWEGKEDSRNCCLRCGEGSLLVLGVGR